MSEANSGSAMLAGNPSGQQPDGNTGGVPASATPPNGTAGNSNAPTGNWYDGFEDADLKGYVQNKAWKDPSELALGYRNLEKLLGGEKLPMPKGADDKEGWGRVYDALGRPKTAEEYKLPVPEGDSGEFAKVASGKFHELGLTAQQAQGLAEWWNQTQQGQAEQSAQAQSQNVEKQLTDLKTEWGGAYDENIELGRRAAREFGMTQEMLTKMENGMGTAEMLKFMSKIGRGMTEHNFEGGKTNSGFGMTPEAARTRINDLRNDQAWASKYLSGDADARAEMARLMALGYPEQA